MPLQLRTTTLSTAVCAEGLRCYTKTADGEVREACNDTSDAALAKAISAKDTTALESREGWYPGTLKFHCSPDSSLCTFAWAPWHQSIFYQSEDYVLREKRRSPASTCEWVDTDFVQADCMPGTNLAAIHSANAERVVLFWQDKDGWLCYRKAQGLVWDEQATRLCKAIVGTGIGAASWNDLVDIRVYYQDEYHVIREYRGGFDSTWKHVDGFTIKFNTPVGDITAISWKGSDNNVEARLYLQDDDDAIIEWCNSGKGWHRGQFKQTALPEADVTAFVRHIPSDVSGYLITVMWTGQDQMLYQQIYSESLQAWLRPTQVTDLQNAGTSVGVWIGDHFSDNCPGIDIKAIRSITVSTDAGTLTGLSIAYDDATETMWHGSQRGTRHQFALEAGEDVTQVFVSWSETAVEGLQFITSKGCESPWYGRQSENPLLWEYRGHPLAGFMGTVGERIGGLKPFWSSRESSTSLRTIDENIVLSTRIGKDIARATANIDALGTRSAAYTKNVGEGLTPPALAAMRGVSGFVGAVEYLHELVVIAKTAQAEDKPDVPYRAADIKTNVERCQAEANEIERLLGELATAANKLVPEGEQITREVTAEIESAKLRSDRLAAIRASAEGLKVMAESKRKELTAARDRADKDMREARQAEAKAQDQRDTKAAYKFVRDVVTLGIGNRFDVFGFNKNIASINELIAAKRKELEAARTRLDSIICDIKKVTDDLARIGALATATEGQQTTLDGVRSGMTGLLDQNRDVADGATRLAALLRQMHASSEELDDQSSADAFARGVLKIGELADSSAWLKGLMGERGVVLRNTIKRVAGTVKVSS